MATTPRTATPAAEAQRPDLADAARVETLAQADDAALDEALRETFPASDPVAVAISSVAVAPKTRPQTPQ